LYSRFLEALALAHRPCDARRRQTVEPEQSCPSCGRPVAGDRDFCDSCGAYLRWDDDADEQTSVLEPRPEPEPAEPEPETPSDEPPPTTVAKPEPAVVEEEDVVVRLRRPEAGYGSTAPVELAVEPGGRASLIGLVRNQSGIVEHYELRIEGLPAAWATITPPALDLVPLGSAEEAHEAEATIELHPPRTCEARAGVRAVRLVASSTTRGAETESNEAALEIAAFELFDGRLRPARVRGKQTARFDLPLRNRGNAPLVLTPYGEDDEGELTFTFEPPRLEIPPCGEARTVVHASAPVLRKGPERARSLTVHLEGTETALAGAATFHQEPSVRESHLALWRIAFTVLAAVLLVAASFAHWTSTRTGVCTDGPDTCLRYDSYVENDLDIDVYSPGDLGELTRLFNFGTSLGILTLLAAALIVLGALTGRLAWFAGLFALLVLTAFAVTSDESLGAGIWLGYLGVAAAIMSAVLATMARRRS
jgi:hypothetical protein